LHITFPFSWYPASLSFSTYQMGFNFQLGDQSQSQHRSHFFILLSFVSVIFIKMSIMRANKAFSQLNQRVWSRIHDPIETSSNLHTPTTGRILDYSPLSSVFSLIYHWNLPPHWNLPTSCSFTFSWGRGLCSVLVTFAAFPTLLQSTHSHTLVCFLFFKVFNFSFH